MLSRLRQTLMDSHNGVLQLLHSIDQLSGLPACLTTSSTDEIGGSYSSEKSLKAPDPLTAFILGGPGILFQCSYIGLH
jgi:hypothetical protein